MIIVIQRVKKASVQVENQIISEINQGYLLLVGLHKDDTDDIIKKAASKISKLRIFSDSEGLMNLNINQVHGEVLSVSQFTLYGDIKKQNRPGFTEAMPFDKARDKFAYFNQCLIDLNLSIKTGCFGEHMDISLINDGPVTIIYETSQ